VKFSTENVSELSCLESGPVQAVHSHLGLWGMRRLMESTAIEDVDGEAGERSVVGGDMIKQYKSRWPLGTGDC